MKIAIDVSQIVYEGTGVENYTRGLVENLIKIDHKNEYIFFGFSLRRTEVLSIFFKTLTEINNKVKTKCFPIPQRLGNFLWNKLHLINIETLLGEIDIYHSSDWLQIPAKKAKKVTTVHDLIVYKYPATSHPYIIETQKKRLHWVRNECYLVFSDSEATKNDLVEILHFDKEKLAVVYPGIDEFYRKQGFEEIIRVKQKYGLYDDYLLFVGIQDPRKNLERVISAFEIFLRHPLIKSWKNPIELVIVGKKGWDEENKNENMRKNKYIKRLGMVNKEDMPALYCGASLFIYPSLYEGFGLPVLEAMRCGCPVITSSFGSLKEVVSNASLLVDPYDVEDISVKMTKLFIDKELRESCVKKGLENASKYRWEKTASDVLNLYESLK